MKKVGQSGYIGIVVHKLNPKARIFKIIFSKLPPEQICIKKSLFQ